MSFMIKLDGIERELEYNFSSLKVLEKSTGRSVGEIMRSVLRGGFKFGEIPDFLAAGFRMTHPELTVPIITEMLDKGVGMKALREMMETVSSAFNNTFNEDSKNGSSPKAKIPTGKKKK